MRFYLLSSIFYLLFCAFASAQTSGQYEIRHYTATGMVSEWLTKQNSKAIGFDSSGNLGMISSGSADWGTITNIPANVSSLGSLGDSSGWLKNNGTGTLSYSTPTKTDIGLSSVENTAISTWAGSTSITTLGTIATGIWHGTSIADSYISSATTWNGKQAAYANLTSIGGLANGAGWLKNDGAGTFTYTTPTATDVGLGSVTNDAQTKASVVPNTAPSSGQILIGNAGNTAFAKQTITGGASAGFILTSGGVLTVSAIANSSLSNSTITIAGTSTALGGTITLDTITGLSSTGLVRRSGANALVIAVAGTDYVVPSGSVATLTTPRAIYGNNFDGSAALTQIIASTYGGTGNGFTKFSGPTTAEKTFTLPNASATILTDNAVVTSAQGGTGVNNAGTLTNASNTTITGGGTIALGGFTATIPATGTVELLGTAQTISAAKTFSAAGAASTPSVSITGTLFTGGSGTTTTPLFLIENSGATAVTGWNVNGTALGINIKEPASNANFIDCHLNGSASVFLVDRNGTFNARYNGTVYNSLDVGSNGSGTLLCTNSTNIGTNISLSSTGMYSWAAPGPWYTTPDLYLTREAAGVLQQGQDSATPVAQTYKAPDARAGTDTNAAGTDITIAAGRGTGNAAVTSSRVILQSPVAVASGTGAQTLTTGLTIINGTAKLTSYTVATLPSASTCGAGAEAFVTDATSTTAYSTVAGGGSNKVVVVSDGTNWLVH